MAEGRTLQRHLRMYMNGLDLSSDFLSVGALSWDYGHEAQAALNWEIAGGLCDQATIATGTCNTLLNTGDPAGAHEYLQLMDGELVAVTVPFGIRAAPAAGDPVWCAMHYAKAKVTPPASGMVTGTIDYSPANVTPANAKLVYDVPWGVLLHAKGAETAANSATGIDGGAATTAGGYIVAQVFAIEGTGTVTIKAQSASTNSDGSFADVAGLTLDFADTDVPSAAVAQAATDETIERYTRWQIVPDVGVDSVTFALALIRGR